MKRLKAVSPCLREKKRYLAYEVLSKQPINDKKVLFDALNKSFIDYLGQLEAGKASIIIMPEIYIPVYKQSCTQGTIRGTIGNVTPNNEILKTESKSMEDFVQNKYNKYKKQYNEPINNYTINKYIINGIIKVNNKYVDHVRASLCFVNRVGEQDVIVRSIKVSGMIGKIKRHIIDRKMAM
ncbi:MAG: Rpp14/Pop5 family protein [Candidatus Woesearchaeota archaeon]